MRNTASAKLTFADPVMKGLGPFTPRAAHAPRVPHALQLPAGTVVVSADDHWEINRDIFYERFPERLRAKAPRVWFDSYWHIGYPGELENFTLGGGAKMERGIVLSTGAGVGDQALHQEHMTLEGIDKAIMFPQSLLSFIRLPDLEVLELMYRTYNEYIAELQAASGGRTFGVGIFSNWWDPAKAETAMRQIVDLGLKSVMVPVTPGKAINGEKILYGSPVMDRLWRVVEESGLPLNFHVGEGVFEDIEQRGGMATTMMLGLAPFRRPFAQLVFGGVFDRHPKLRVIFSEGGLAWVLSALQDAEMLCDLAGDHVVDPIEHRPTHYWRHHCYATFQNDLVGLRNIDYIGADRVMWGADYPHSEGTFGYTGKSLQSILDAVSVEDAKMIIGGTATKVYGL